MEPNELQRQAITRYTNDPVFYALVQEGMRMAKEKVIGGRKHEQIRDAAWWGAITALLLKEKAEEEETDFVGVRNVEYEDVDKLISDMQCGRYRVTSLTETEHGLEMKAEKRE